MSEHFPKLNPQVRYAAEGPDSPIAVDFVGSTAEFGGEAQLNQKDLREGDVVGLSLEDRFTGGDLTVRLPVVEVRKKILAHGDTMGHNVIVDYNGQRAVLGGSVLSEAGVNGPSGIVAGTYPRVAVEPQSGQRPEAEILGQTKAFQVERPDSEGVLHPLSLNALSRREAYTSPNRSLITNGNKVIQNAIDTILPGVNIEKGVEGRLKAGATSMALSVDEHARVAKVFDTKTGNLTVISAYPNGSLETSIVTVPAADIERVENSLESDGALFGVDVTTVRTNFNDQRQDLDGAVTVSLGSKDLESVVGEGGNGAQTLFGDGTLSRRLWFGSEPQLLSRRGDKVTVLGNPPQTIDPLKQAQKALKTVSAGMKQVVGQQGRSPGSVSVKFIRKQGDVTEGTFSIEDLSLSIPENKTRTQRLWTALGSVVKKVVAR